MKGNSSLWCIIYNCARITYSAFTLVASFANCIEYYTRAKLRRMHKQWMCMYP